jgi:DNA-binding HxlR family transcriptional regulator
MLKRTYDNQVCSVAWTLEVVGERWTLLIVRDALMMGVSRFGAFRQRLGIAASVLTARLDRLIAAGVLDRTPYHTRPVRYEYRLTPKGRELGLVVLALMHWGDQHLAGEAGPPRTARHDGCGGRVQSQLVCMTCAAAVSPDEVTTERTERRRQPQP